MQAQALPLRLEQEFRTRREKNPRYSLRAFARFLGTDHSTLSQVLRGRRRAAPRLTCAWAKKLGWPREDTVACIAAYHLQDAVAAERAHQLRQQTVESTCLITERAHWEILRLCRAAGFRPDCRWIAAQIGVPVDQVNLALTRLLRLRLLEMTSSGQWRSAAGAGTERAFKKIALAQISG